MNENIMNYSIIKNLVEKDRGIINLRKIKDSSSRYRRYFKMTSEDIQISINNFDRTFGVVSDGTQQSIDDGNSYFRIVTDLTIPNTYNKGFLTNLKELAMLEIPIFFIYLNGVKIPEHKILVYRSNSNTDIFIPYDYIDLANEIDVIIESVNLSDFQYIMGSFDNLVSSVVTINLDNIKVEYLPENFSFKKENFMIYVNGVLRANDAVETIEYNTESKNLRLSLDIDMNQTVKTLEVYYDNFIRLRKKKIYENPTVQNSIIIDLSEYTDPIHGPVPKKSLKFFVNGLKYDNLKITQIGRSFYHISTDSNVLVTSYDVTVSDIGYIDDTKLSVMGSDYFLEKMIGSERIINYLQTNQSKSIFDNYDLDLSKVLLGDSEEIYNDNKNGIYLRSFLNSGNDFGNQFERMVQRNPHICKDYLKNFARPSSYYFITKTEDDEEYSLALKSSYKEDEYKLFVDLYINRKYVNKTLYSIVGGSIKLNKSLLKDGLNLIEFTENIIPIDKSDVNHSIILLNELELLVNSFPTVARLTLKKSDYPLFTNIENISILEKVYNDENYIYADATEMVGYKGLNETMSISENDTDIIVEFSVIPQNELLLLFTDFYYIKNGVYNSQVSKSDEGSSISVGSVDLSQLIPIYSGPSSNPIPVIKRGVPELYVNGELYIYGKDYNYITPENNGKLATSCIMIIRQISSGDNYSITFTQSEDSLIVSKVDCPQLSDYGLMYFGDMKFPFDPYYMDIFIDSEKVFLRDIDILSDKLIRIKNLPVPFTDIMVKTRFNININELEPYFNFYKENEFETIIKELFYRVDYTKDKLLFGDEEDPDEVYKSFEVDVGHTNPTIKEPNEVKPDDDIIRVDIVDTMYLQWLISDDARSIINTGENIDDIVFGFFDLYNISNTTDDENVDIVIDCSVPEFTFNNNEDIVFDCNQPSLKIGEKFTMITGSIIENSENNEVNLNNLYDEFLTDIISNKILPADFPRFEHKHDKYNQFEGLEEDITPFSNNDHIHVSEKHFKPLFDYDFVNIKDYEKI